MQWKALVSLLLSCSEAVSIILFLILTSIIIIIDGYNFIWGFLLLYNVAEIYLCLWQIHRLIFFLSSPLAHLLLYWKMSWFLISLHQCYVLMKSRDHAST